MPEQTWKQHRPERRTEVRYQACNGTGRTDVMTEDGNTNP
ncbi:hypothetical protein LEMLEM_LOCUS25088, partial [Lemmus lemmus]